MVAGRGIGGGWEKGSCWEGTQRAMVGGTIFFPWLVCWLSSATR